LLRALLALALTPALSLPAAAQLNRGVPLGTEASGVTQKIGAQLPLELEFNDTSGQPVKLGQLLGRGRPALLTLNYSDCPQLCVLQLDGVMKACGDLGLTLGQDYDLLTVSVDPKEAPARAAATRERYLERFAGERTPEAWSFLTTPVERNIRTVADSVGYGYWLDPNTGEYSHEAVLMVLTEAGQVSRYLFGIDYPPSDLRMALVEAAEGRLGSLADRIRFMCYQYDPNTNSYAPEAMAIMRLGGLVTVLVLGTTLLFFWRSEITSLLRGGPAAS
jgi:protein SCO1/2